MSRIAATLHVVTLLTLGACRSGTPEPGADDGSMVFAAGTDELLVCTGARPFFGSSSSAFDFKANELSLANAFWMAVTASHAYAKKDVVLAELERLGFKDDNDSADDRLFFMEEDGVARNFLRTGLDFKFANTQGYWAESAQGAILAFRGTEPDELADVITDIWATQTEILKGGMEAIAGAPAADESEIVPSPASSGADVTQIYVHKGFTKALDIVWKSIEARAKELYAAQRPKEKVDKIAVLDALGAKHAAGDTTGLGAALKDMQDWVAPLEGKRNLVKTWRSLGGDAPRRDELFELIDKKWASWQKPIWVTGHSLGGALATLSAYRLLKMGLNVKGIFTFGSPRIGNHAFMHDLRVLAFDNGIKLRGEEGNLARFVNHRDVVSRVPPAFGWTSAADDSIINPVLDTWRHAAKTNYLTGDETDAPELWRQGVDDDRFAEHPLIEYTVKMPLDKWKTWATDHDSREYVRKLEKIAFGTRTPCD